MISQTIKYKIKYGLALVFTAVTLVVGAAFTWSVFFEPGYLQSLADSIPGI